MIRICGDSDIIWPPTSTVQLWCGYSGPEVDLSGPEVDHSGLQQFGGGLQWSGGCPKVVRKCATGRQCRNNAIDRNNLRNSIELRLSCCTGCGHFLENAYTQVLFCSLSPLILQCSVYSANAHTFVPFAPLFALFTLLLQFTIADFFIKWTF